MPSCHPTKGASEGKLIGPGCVCGPRRAVHAARLVVHGPQHGYQHVKLTYQFAPSCAPTPTHQPTHPQSLSSLLAPLMHMEQDDEPHIACATPHLNSLHVATWQAGINPRPAHLHHGLVHELGELGVDLGGHEGQAAHKQDRACARKTPVHRREARRQPALHPSGTPRRGAAHEKGASRRCMEAARCPCHSPPPAPAARRRHSTGAQDSTPASRKLQCPSPAPCPGLAHAPGSAIERASKPPSPPDSSDFFSLGAALGALDEGASAVRVTTGLSSETKACARTTIVGPLWAPGRPALHGDARGIPLSIAAVGPSATPSQSRRPRPPLLGRGSGGQAQDKGPIRSRSRAAPSPGCPLGPGPRAMAASRRSLAARWPRPDPQPGSALLLHLLQGLRGQHDAGVGGGRDDHRGGHGRGAGQVGLLETCSTHCGSRQSSPPARWQPAAWLLPRSSVPHRPRRARCGCAARSARRREPSSGAWQTW
jgi:hypothetical protein